MSNRANACVISLALIPVAPLTSAVVKRWCRTMFSSQYCSSSSLPGRRAFEGADSAADSGIAASIRKPTNVMAAMIPLRRSVVPIMELLLI